jgi:hypothetical protein
MPKKDEYVVCLAGGISQVKFLKSIKKMGYKIILVDRNLDIAGNKYSDLRIVESILNYEEILRKIQKYISLKLDIVKCISLSIGGSFSVANKLNNYLGVGSIDEKSLNILTDKKLLRETLNNICCSNIPIFNKKELLSNLPVIVKPRYNGTGSKNILFFRESRELLDFDLSLLSSKDYVFEKLLYGTEITVDVLTVNGRIEICNIGRRIFDKKLDLIIGSSSETFYEFFNLEKNLFFHLGSIIKHFNLKNEFFRCDAIIEENEVINIIEIEFLPIDATHHLRVCYDYDLVKNFISLKLKFEIENLGKKNNNSYLIYDFFELKKVNNLLDSVEIITVNRLNLSDGRSTDKCLLFVSNKDNFKDNLLEVFSNQISFCRN